MAQELNLGKLDAWITGDYGEEHPDNDERLHLDPTNDDTDTHNCSWCGEDCGPEPWWYGMQPFCSSGCRDQGVDTAIE